jgi:hypothetical protein
MLPCGEFNSSYREITKCGGVTGLLPSENKPYQKVRSQSYGQRDKIMGEPVLVDIASYSVVFVAPDTEESEFPELLARPCQIDSCRLSLTWS